MASALRLVPAGSFDLAHAAEVVRAVEQAERGPGSPAVTSNSTCRRSSASTASGAVLLARLIDRLEARGLRTRLVEDHNPHAARLITLYRERRTEALPAAEPQDGPARPSRGGRPPRLPAVVTGALDFIGHAAAALPKAIVSPRSVDWASLPRLMQAIGADALPVTSAANLLIGLIIGFLGVSQLGRFGAVVYVPELVVIAQFRELGPLVTAIVVAGPLGRGPGLGARHDAGLGGDRCAAVDGIRPGALAGRAALPGARGHRADSHVDWRRAGARRRAPRHDRHHGHDAARLRARHRRGDHGRALPHGHDQDALPRR